MKMAEQKMGTEQETRPVDNRHDEEGEENGETNTTLLAGLNLVLIISFLSLSAEDRSNLDEIQETETEGFNHKNSGASSSISSFQTRRKVNQSPKVERQKSTVHSKIQDSR